MAGAILERELTPPRPGKASFALASIEDDAEIRRLLRENPMAGQISLSLEREPSFFAGEDWPGQSRQTIISKEENRIVCVGSCTFRRRFVNGEPLRVGYLSGLRLDGARGGRFDIVRRGYEFFQRLQGDRPADFYFTSIAADNRRARQFLERNLRGMPRYEFMGEFVTVALNTQRGTAKMRNIEDVRAFVASLNTHNRGLQFAPFWSGEELTALKEFGLRLGDRAAFWDQRSFKQSVVRGYAPLLKLARPFLNIVAHAAGRPKLPKIGEALATTFVSHLTVEPESLAATIKSFNGSVTGVDWLILGFAENDPRLAIVRRHFRCREYRTGLYVVSWPGGGGTMRELDDRMPAPEVALL